MSFLEVQLRAAKIPLLGWLAVHYWFVVIEEQTVDRWEIWQNQHRSPHSWGHLHKNLLLPESGVGNGASWLVQSWTGDRAQILADFLAASPQIYPHNYCYRYVPGPNSNTYVRWILQQAKVDYPLGRKAIGQNYVYFSRVICWRSPKKSIPQLRFPFPFLS